MFHLNIYDLTASELSSGIKNGDFSSEEVVETLFERNKKIENKIHAFISQTYELAKAQAKKVDAKIKKGELIVPNEAIKGHCEAIFSKYHLSKVEKIHIIKPGE